jgi:histidinol-phosphate aminotransferase
MTGSCIALPDLIARILRPEVVSMHAYAVQDATGLLKMDAMENPYRLPPALQVELGKRLGGLALNRYPGSGVEALRQALKSYAQVPAGFDIMLGNGSDELISLLAMVCGKPGACVLAPIPGFVMYELSARLQGMPFVGVSLDPEFELDQAAMLAAIALHRPALVYLAYPNNPTANLWSDAVIEKIIGAAPGIVVMDEAYQPFAGKSFIDRISRYKHVLLMRTLSKFGLAGVRIGYMVGRTELVAQIDKVRPPYNISVLNAECGLFALEHAEVFAAQALEIVGQRASLLDALGRLPGVRAYRSDANMVLLRLLQHPGAQATFAATVCERMKTLGVLVKNVSGMHPSLAGCLRLTVGSAEENGAMLAALKESL